MVNQNLKIKIRFYPKHVEIVKQKVITISFKKVTEKKQMIKLFHLILLLFRFIFGHP